MDTLIEMAHMQNGFFLISFIIISCCFFVIAASKIIGGNEPSYSPVFGFGFVLFIVGINSILIDFNIATIILNHYGRNLLSFIMAASFIILIICWGFVVMIMALKMSKYFKIIKNDMSQMELFIVALPVIFVMISIVKIMEIGDKLIRTGFLNNVLFIVIPGITFVVAIVCLFARRLAREY